MKKFLIRAYIVLVFPLKSIDLYVNGTGIYSHEDLWRDTVYDFKDGEIYKP